MVFDVLFDVFLNVDEMLLDENVSHIGIGKACEKIRVRIITGQQGSIVKLFEIVVNRSVIRLNINQPVLVIGTVASIESTQSLNKMDRRVEGYNSGPTGVFLTLKGVEELPVVPHLRLVFALVGHRPPSPRLD